MKQQIISDVVQQMLPHLDNAQLKELQKVLEYTLFGCETTKQEEKKTANENPKLIDDFVAAKRIEGCSEKTLKYYRTTIEAMVISIDKNVRHIQTEDLRSYLTDYQSKNQSSRVTIDNIRRILSSFFSWLEDEDYILKSPVRRIHKVKTVTNIKETYTDEELEKMRDNCTELRDLAIIDMLASTGMRIGEMVLLNKADINFNERECVVFGKGDKERIDDKTREVVGIPEDKVFQEIDVITNAISDSCEPTIIPDVYLQNINGKPVIVAEIRAGRQKPYYIKADGLENGVYIRVSGTTRPADRDMSRELYYECDAHSFDSVIRRDIEVTDEDIKNLCEQMKEVAIANSKSNLQRSAVKDVTKNVLLSWGILKKDENEKIYPTNAYVYLTGQGGLRSMIQCAVFKGTTRAIFLDRRNYEGPLWEQVDEAVQFVLRNICMGCRLEGVYRQDIYELPPDSIRELIVNAVMNCSYIQVSNIQVAIYDDRLEITSPGGLLPGVTIDLMKEGFSKIRNRSLANAFAYMNLVEAWGSGIPKLMQAMQEYGLREPEFIDMEVAFRINLYRGQNEVIEGKKTNIELNDLKVDLETRLSEMIRKNPELTHKMLGEALSVSSATIKRTLAKMQKEGKVVREGSNRKGKWMLTDKK